MKKRVFVALEISDESRKKVSDYVKNLSEGFSSIRVGWEKAEKLHLTLKFLGEISDTDIAHLMNATRIASEKFSPFKLKLTGTGVFPHAKKPKVLWIGINGATKVLTDLNGELEKVCKDYDFARNEKIFKPHLTIARLREPEKSQDLVGKHLSENFEPVEFEVSEIVVFQSILQTTGSIYKKIGTFKFGKEKV